MEKYSSDKECVVMSRDEVRAVDQWAINTLGVPGVVLMENAGRSCAELIKEKLVKTSEPKVCIFCGTGNNGGDGYVIARHLLNYGFRVTVVVCGDRGKIKGDAKINLDILERMGQPIDRLDLKSGDIPGQVKAYATGTDMLVDALFGTGLNGQLSGPYKQLIESINSENCPVLAVDIPSGLDCDTGEPLGAAIRANCTVTFIAMKKGFTCTDVASRYTGDIFIASIGVEPGNDTSH
ncbi:MAG: NAD(P)H-hydrate epimerase [Planctomycetota bacterium]|jgi:NAD(P)H-hydrate epimerase